MRMNRRRSKALVTIGGCLALTSLIAQQKLAPEISIQSKASAAADAIETGGRIIWQNREFRARRHALLNYQISDAKQHYVAIYHSGDAALNLNSLASQHSLTLMAQQPAEPSKLWVSIYQFSNANDLDALQSSISQETHSCGNMQVFSLEDSIVDQPQLTPPAFYSRADFTSQLTALLQETSIDRISQDIARLEALGTRHYTSGTTAPDLIKTMMEEAGSGIPGLAIELVSNSLTDQPSVVARIPGATEPDTSIVIGAHLDSIARPSSDAPGADDDASGVSILIELLRILAAKSLQFERSIELHAYGSEEIGLIGSRSLAQQYQEESRIVGAMMQLDMTAYGPTAEDPTIFLVDHDTSYELRRQAIAWIHRYLDGDFALGTLPVNATSDHKSWYDRGYPTLFPFENVDAYNPHIHTREDTSANLNNLALTKNISALALIYLSYQAGLVDLRELYNSQTASLFTSDSQSLLLAIRDLDENLYSIAVSAANTVESVDICPIDTRESTGCLELRKDLESQLTRGNRRIFYTANGQSFATGQKWRIEAFDQEENQVAMRQIVFE